MRVLTDPASIKAEIASCPDPSIARLLARHLQFMGEYDGDESLTALLVEPGDELHTLDVQTNGLLLTNAYAGKRYGEAGFVPSFETLEAHPTFYEMFFVEGGGEVGISVLIPKQRDIDAELLAICAEHATPARGHSR